MLGKGGSPSRIPGILGHVPARALAGLEAGRAGLNWRSPNRPPERPMREQLPQWMDQWLGVIVPARQVLLGLVVAFVLRRLARLLIDGLATRSGLPPTFGLAALRLLLERLGVSGTVLWPAFTGFATVAAVAFFAAWSVLSNIFCSLLIFIMRPFRLLDHIELLESGDKPGLRGRVIDVNLVYTT